MFVGARDKDSTCPIFLPTKAKEILPLGLAFVFLGCVDLSEGSRRYRGTVPFLRLLQISKTLATGGRTRANLATGVKGSVPRFLLYRRCGRMGNKMVDRRF